MEGLPTIRTEPKSDVFPTSFQATSPVCPCTGNLADWAIDLLGHFFSNSVQFCTTVIGSDASSESTELMRNFWPSGITAQR